METKGVTCKVPLDLHNRISEEIRETESTMSKFIEMVIREHYEKGVNKTMEKGRTLAFQVSEELFQRVKEYLDRYEKTYHRRLTQKEFVIGLIEQALEEAEEEFMRNRQRTAGNPQKAPKTTRTRKYPTMRNQRAGTSRTAKRKPRQKKMTAVRDAPARTARIPCPKAGIRMKMKKPSRMTIPWKPANPLKQKNPTNKKPTTPPQD